MTDKDTYHCEFSPRKLTRLVEQLFVVPAKEKVFFKFITFDKYTTFLHVEQLPASFFNFTGLLRIAHDHGGLRELVELLKVGLSYWN